MVNFYKLVGRTIAYCFLLTTLAALTVGKAVAQLNGNYTINKAAVASSTNYTTFQSFFTDLSGQGVSGNVTVSVLNGPYTEQVTANAIPNASATKSITINGNNQILQFTASSSTAQHTFRFNGADYVTLNNLYIKALGTTYSWGVHFMNGSDYNTLDGCIVEITNSTSTTISNNIGINICNSTSSYSTLGNAAKYTTIKNCTVKGNGATRGPYIGIMVTPQSQNVDSYTTIEKNTILDFYSQGIYMYYASKVDVKNNDISRPSRTNSTTAYGIYMYYYCYRNNITGNKIHNMYTSYSTYTGTCYGISSYYNYSGASNSLIANNYIYNIDHNGYLYGIYSYYSQGVVFTHNTVSDNLTTTNTSYRYGLYVYSATVSMAGTEFTNNIVSITRPGTGYRYAYYYYANIPVIDNNSYWINGTGSNNFFATGLSVYNDFDSWRTGTGKDQSSEYTNPLFLNSGAGDLTPTVVQLDGIGTPKAAVTTDINGNPRNMTDADPGAVNFDVDANVTRLSLSGPNNCQAQVETVKVWVKNSSPNPQTGFKLAYRINGGTEVIEPFTGTINGGDSVLYSFNQKVTYNTSGVYSYQARIKGKAQMGPYVVNVNPAPLGSEAVKGATYTGQFNSGSVGDPDIVANPDEINFELTPPTGYSNSGFGTTWYISKMVASTINGTPLNTADTATFLATPSANARIRYRPSAGFTDSFVKFTSTVYSLTTNCYAPDITRVVFVAPRPKAGATVVDFCDGDEAVFESNSTITTGSINYLWDFGDGTTSSYADNNKSYTTYGTYNVTLTVTSNYGYTDAITKTVNVYRKPTAAYTATNQCIGSPVPFTNNSTSYNGSASYHWDFGNGVTSTSMSPSYSYPSVGSYMVKLIITDAKGCTQSIAKPVTTSNKPLADFSFPASVCNDASVSFTNTSIAPSSTGYTWKFGDSTTVSQVSPSHTYTASGVYKVTVIAINEFGCADSMTKAVTLNESPAINYTVSSQCIGEPVTFTNTTTEPAGQSVSYTWEFGDGATSSNKNETHTYLGIGEYDVVLTASASNGCISEQRSKVAFAEKPIADFSLPETACVNDQVEFINNSIANQSALSYSWDLGNGNSTDKNPTTSYTAAGKYTVVLTASSVQGCSQTASKDITVSNLPNSNFNSESTKTGDGRITFKPENPSGTGTYVWVYGDGGQSNNKEEHAYRFLSPAGLFKVTLRITENGCTSSTTKEVIINTLGVDDVEGGLGIEVYPNPNAGNFVVDMGSITDAGVTILNIAGQAMKHYTAAEAVNGKLAVDLSGIAAGVYFVQVQSNGRLVNKKVTITK